MSSRRSLTLHEIATVLEEDDDFSNQRQDFDIFLLPPDTANDYQTDEDSGEEDNVSINNLPGSLLRAPAELAASTSMEKPETEDQTPPEFQEPLKKTCHELQLAKTRLAAKTYCLETPLSYSY
ncbi:unnamed protein product [Parnassius apollo]|uniref:(apollo) hypothetical protein n=1 Tax=Parnassius apollo TaxID=110799 RepID=A0A8S3Y7H5_PARAO|nr:unnamed protein product [Parnassius apollo]